MTLRASAAQWRAEDGKPILGMQGMTLRDLLVDVETRAVLGNPAVNVASVAYDSRQVKPGAVFVAIRGEKVDGNQFVSDAIRQGAVAIVSEQPAAQGAAPVVWAQVGSARRALATISSNYFGRPVEALKLVGITGTNGKTTTTFVVDSILRAAGYKAGLFGTVEYRLPTGSIPASRTTPESYDLQQFLAQVRDASGSHAVFEVSSHALALDRVWGCPFAVAMFSNITRDHLDYHKTLENYFAAKRRLFEGTGAGVPTVGVINTDDPRGRELVGLAGRTLTYGLEGSPDISASSVRLSFRGLEFTAQTPAGKLAVHSPLVARINVYNILAAVGAAVALGIPPRAIEIGIRQLERVPGRFERVDSGQPFLVIVDYAHTHDAIESVIATARELNPHGRVIIVFGCGGGKDRTKRPLMGEVAGRSADLVVLSSDNPRQEDPLLIINDVLVGLQKVNAKYLVEPDREKAIALAFDQARPGDLVLMTGKGHENVQILADRTLEFNDGVVARRLLAERGFASTDAHR